MNFVPNIYRVGVALALILSIGQISQAKGPPAKEDVYIPSAPPEEPGEEGSGAIDLFIPVQPQRGDPFPDLTAGQLDRFQEGKKLFNKNFEMQDGLGPIFNQQNCSACHTNGGGQTGLTQNVTRFGQDNNGVFSPLAHLGGSLRQGQIVINPNNTCSSEQIPAAANVITKRISPPVFGSGLIESIPDETIVNLAGGSSDYPGVAGAVHWVQPLEGPSGTFRVGKFGWKAQVATVLSFSADAANNELGLTNELLPHEQQPNALPGYSSTCDDGVQDPDDVPNANGDRIIDLLTDYMRYLAPPPQTPKSGMAGEQIFIQAGCAECHTPVLMTGYYDDVEAVLRNKEVKAYSDFLLHDMGTLGDGIVQGNAAQQQMRTPPLWDLRYRFALLHDQRHEMFGVYNPAKVDLAILDHDGEAAFSKSLYQNLPQVDKDKLIDFLGSLGRREFDIDGQNGRLDARDFVAFRQCHDQPQPHNYDPDHLCAISDINQDTVIDNADFDSLVTVYRGPIDDCQCDGQIDLGQILNGTSADLDNNASPDECRATSSIGNPRVTLYNGQYYVQFVLENAAPNKPVEIYYSLAGQGNGQSLPGVICLNLSNYQLLVSTTTNGSGLVFYNAQHNFPPGTEEIYLQAVIVDGNNSTKTNVAKSTYSEQ